MFDGLKYLVVGSGFSGAVLAEKIASELAQKVVVLEKRSHIGGNSYSFKDSATGIECHKYGSHIFHTKSEKVWNYLNGFDSFTTYQHKVLTKYNGRMYQMPINLKTVNDFFGIDLSPSECEDFLKSKREDGKVPLNLEEKAISLVGSELYNAFIKGYTKKQWETDPKELSADIITRLPVRNNYNANYFNDPYQGLPLNGYEKLFEKILSHKNINVMLNTDFFDIKDKIPDTCKIIYTGPLDRFFNFKFGSLDWRSLSFEWEVKAVQDWQGNSVVNYSHEDVPFTRIHEFKHYHPEREEVFASASTVICKEYSKKFSSNDEPYYPIENTENKLKHSLYMEEAQKNKNLAVLGRLASYKYWDMDIAVKNALDLFETIKNTQNAR